MAAYSGPEHARFLYAPGKQFKWKESPDGLLRGALGFSVLRFWLFFRSVFRFLLQKTSVFRFWWSLGFADFSFFSIWFSVFVKNTSGFLVLVPDVVFGFSYFVLLKSNRNRNPK